jgi:predicted transcriptional regulator
MNNQLTFRLPREVALALARRARERRVPKSRLVREALEAYLGTAAAPASRDVPPLQRIAAFVGALALDRAALERDALARQIRRRNWRSAGA